MRLLDTPLINWSIEAANAAELVDDCYVTSESDTVLEMAKRAGAKIIKRPAELATDEATMAPVIIHAIGQMKEKPDLVVLLQHTCPVRPPGLIDQCIKRLQKTGSDSVLTVCESFHFAWRLRETPYFRLKPGVNRLVPINCYLAERKLRQDMEEHEKVYLENGSVYVFNPDKMIEAGNRLCGHVEYYVMDKRHSVDIDDDFDFWMAEKMLEREMSETWRVGYKGSGKRVQALRAHA
jgi:N-acylneuraminate cytidylyltransferase